jgi:N-methylhydantoinase A/oxoprolinase/acetone carboxylase beta subunit
MNADVVAITNGNPNTKTKTEWAGRRTVEIRMIDLDVSGQ